jgi:hypothetical protein
MDRREVTTEVLILTDVHQIRGRIELVPGARLTDFLRDVRDDVIAVTEAHVARLDGVPLFRASFVDVAVRHIRIVTEVANLQEDTGDNGNERRRAATSGATRARAIRGRG